MIKFVRSFLAGSTYHLRAIALLKQSPDLRGYVLIPILVNIIIGLALYLGLLLIGVNLIDTLISNLDLPSWARAGAVTLPVIEWALRILFGATLLLITTFLQVQFGVVLGAPWYGMLSEQLQKVRTGQLPPTEPLKIQTIFKDIGRSLFYELTKLLLTIMIVVLLFILSFLPAFGPVIASFGSIALSATMLCLDFFAPILERLRLSFRTKLDIVRRSFPASGSFGLVCFVLVNIPLLNLVTIPLCVAAGTLFVCDRVLPFLADPTFSDRDRH